MTACAAGCTLRDQHRADCADDTCRGCLPRPAADGLQVCLRDEARARTALRDLPGLWVDVEASMTLKARQRGSRGRGDALPVDVDAADWRLRAKSCLVGWVKVLEEDYAVSLADARDDVAWLAHKVGVHAGRLLASDHAGQLHTDVLELAGQGKRLAFRSSSGAPITVACPGCGTRVRLDPDAEWIECVCGEGGVLMWWQRRLAPDLDLMNAADTVTHILLSQRHRLTEVQLRQWVKRGYVTTRGRDDAGRSLYDPIEVAAVVIQRRARTA